MLPFCNQPLCVGKQLLFDLRGHFALFRLLLATCHLVADWLLLHSGPNLQSCSKIQSFNSWYRKKSWHIYEKKGQAIFKHKKDILQLEKLFWNRKSCHSIQKKCAKVQLHAQKRNAFYMHFHIASAEVG